MKKRLSQAIILCFIIAFLPNTIVFATSVDGDFTTMMWMRQEPITIDGSSSSFPVYEYIRTSITDIGSSDLSAYIYGCVKKDFANNKNPDWRAFSGYLKWIGPGDSSVWLGRQFLPSSPGYWEMDGVRVKFRSLKSFSPSIYVGSSSTPWAIKDEKSGISGIDLDLPEIHQLKGGFSLLANFNSKSFNRLFVGGHLDRYNSDMLEFFKFVMYNKVIFDILNMELAEADVTVNLNPIEKLGLYAEYWHNKQLFPEESIFSVFATDDLNMASFGIVYNLFESVSLEGKYERHFSSSFPSNTYEFSVNRELAYGTTFGANILGTMRSVDNEQNNGFSLSVGRDITRKLSANLSAYYNDYRLRKDQELSRISSIQADLGYRVIDQASAYIRFEDNIDHSNNSSFRLLMMVKVGFGSSQSFLGRNYGDN